MNRSACSFVWGFSAVVFKLLTLSSAHTVAKKLLSNWVLFLVKTCVVMPYEMVQ